MTLSVFEIVLIVFTLLVLLSIVWGTIRLGISPMPSSRSARQAMLELCDEALLESIYQTINKPNAGVSDNGPVRIYELGSGWGNMLVALARRYPQHIIVGYELSFVPWLVSIVWLKLLRLNNVSVHRQDFFKVDLSSAKLALCYLYPQGMVKLEAKLTEDTGSLNYLISHHFALPHHEPIKTLWLKDVYQTPIYLYEVR
ncbi:MAG: SAM-dependent methyltransferase [Bermanella sp.]|nr:SAM-dependent methyltransferase [Bermanella sp.]